MGKLILIMGENDSGKSRFAEQIAAQMPGKRFYLATMIPVTVENSERIQKHRIQRKHLHCQTFELPYRISNRLISADDTVLLEDVSNLLANNLFEKKGTMISVFDDIKQLKEQCRCMIAVTISALQDECYEGETKEYIRALNQLNQMLFTMADSVAEMNCHIPVCRKGSLYDLI